MDIAMNLGNFRNIDMISQGYYYVKIQIYTEQDNVFS